MHASSVSDKEAWLQALLKNNNSQTPVDATAFLIVLRALRDANDVPDAALRAERWLVMMEKRQLQATPECYQLVLETWARATTEDPALAVTRAKRWVYSQNSVVDTAGCNAFLDLASKGRGRRQLLQEHATVCRDLLERMIQNARRLGTAATTASCIMAPDTDSFNYVIRAYTRLRKDPHVADHALQILKQLEEYQRTIDPTVRPNLKSYAMVMDAISVRARQLVQQNRLLKHFWKDPLRNGQQQLQLLQEILAFLHTTKDCRPNTTIYNVVIAAWANVSSPLHPEAPLEAERVLTALSSSSSKSQSRVTADATSYQMVLRAWKNSSRRNRGARVTWWLQQQWADYEQRLCSEQGLEVQPTTASYNIVLQVWASLGEPRQAEQVLQELSRHGQQYYNLLPNTESYAAVIREWLAVADNGSWDALEAAAKWMGKVEQQTNDQSSALSSVDWYSEFLNAARKCAPQHPKALELALHIFSQLEASHHTIDCLHYARLLQTGLAALSQEQETSRRTEFITTTIRALTNGSVYYDGWTIEESMRLVDEVFPEWPLPGAWTRNLRQHGFRPKCTDLLRRNYNLSQHGRYTDQLHGGTTIEMGCHQTIA